MSFSQKIGKRPLIKNMQIESIDNELRNRLWNTYNRFIIDEINPESFFDEKSYFENYIDYLWTDFFKIPINGHYSGKTEEIKSYFFQFQWYDVYDFIEFNANPDIKSIANINIEPYIVECNRILESEFSAYRLIKNIIVPISNNAEIDEIKEVLSNTDSDPHDIYENVRYHIQEALSKLSDKKKPDYRNSIKESISAVESICRQLTGKSTLGDALKEMEKKGLKLNLQLKSGIEKLYAYTNDKETGIRHSLIESPSLPTFDEAKFFIVICSAFINFIISKMK